MSMNIYPKNYSDKNGLKSNSAIDTKAELLLSFCYILFDLLIVIANKWYLIYIMVSLFVVIFFYHTDDTFVT